MNGGSLSSDYVMNLLKVPCDTQFPLTEKVNFNVKDISNNFGTVYKATGGGQNGGEMMEKVEGFLQKVVDNRILDVYLKYLGITLLSPATLVPIALIMGKQTFEEVVKNIKKNDSLIQQGGEGFLDVRIPVVDDKIIGTGLKLAGITALTISPYTLVPLGVLMYIYEEFLKEARLPNLVGGGIATVLPMEYFGRKSCSGGNLINNNLDTPQSRSEVFSNQSVAQSTNDIVRPFSGGRKRKQIKRGGYNWDAGRCDQPNLTRQDVGTTFQNHVAEVSHNDIVRPFAGGSLKRSIKKGGYNWDAGRCDQSNLTSSDVGNTFQNHASQVSGNDIVRPFAGGSKKRNIKKGGYNWDAGRCDQSNLTSSDVGNTFQNHASQVSGNDIVRPFAGGSKKRNNKKGGSRSIFGADVPPNIVQQTTALVTGQDIEFPRGNDYLNNHMQITSGQNPSQLHYQAPYHQQLETVIMPTNANTCAATGSCSGTPMGMAGGAGSDWVGTLYSAGPSNNSDMSDQQFQMFNKSQQNPSMNSHTGGLNDRVSNYYNYNNYKNTLEYTPLYAESNCSK